MTEDTQAVERTEEKVIASDKLYMENTLLRVSGALFCHDAKRAPTRTQEIELNRGVLEKNIVIRPDPRIGQPGPLAHKIFVAIIKKHSNYGRPVPVEVTFTKRELMRLIGRKKWGGRDGEQLCRALSEIHYAFVRTSFKGRDGRHVEHSFNLFPEVYLERAESESDPIEKCMVTLARPIVTSLQDQHFTCLNHALMQQLGTIGQALYMRLFFHFANLFDGHHRDRLTFPKRYDDICTEWLGGLTALRYLSDIERDQLGPHLRQLVAVGFLASYRFSKAVRGDGLVLTFRPGTAFFADYNRFYRGRHQGELQYEFHADRREVAEPLKVAYLFIEKRTGEPIKNIPYVSSKDVATAKQLLAMVDFQAMPAFLDYALAEARKTKFDVQTLGGLKQYVAGYTHHEERQAAVHEATAARRTREQDEADRAAYERYRRQAAETLFGALPSAEQETINGLARGKQRPYGTPQGPLAATLYEMDKARITAERHSDRIATYDSWKTTRRAA
jgi:hypothetical protein